MNKEKTELFRTISKMSQLDMLDAISDLLAENESLRVKLKNIETQKLLEEKK